MLMCLWLCVATLFSLVTVVTLSTGKTFLIVNGYTFKKECGLMDGTRWCCSEPSQNKCGVYVHVNEKFELVLMANVHTHEPILCSVFQERMS